MARFELLICNWSWTVLQPFWCPHHVLLSGKDWRSKWPPVFACLLLVQWWTHGRICCLGTLVELQVYKVSIYRLAVYYQKLLKDRKILIFKSVESCWFFFSWKNIRPGGQLLLIYFFETLENTLFYKNATNFCQLCW